MSKEEQVRGKTEQRYAGITLRKLEASEQEQHHIIKSANGLHVWAIGICLVIAGEYYSWNGGLVAAGFVGYLITVLFVAFWYFCFSTCLTELSTTLPFSGGGYAYARVTMGPWMGFVSGLAESLEWLANISANTFVCGQLFDLIVSFSSANNFVPLWWFIVLIVMVIINLTGGKIFFNLTLLIAATSVFLLLAFIVSAFFFTDYKYANNFVPPNPTGWFIDDFTGMFKSLPAAVVFFFGIEGTPLVAEDTVNPKRDMKGLLLAELTIFFLAILILFLNVMIPPGIQEYGAAQYPLIIGFQTVWGQGTPIQLLACFLFVGAIASLHTAIFCFGRQVYSMARSAYVPPILSWTLWGRQPYIAIITGSVIAYAFIFPIGYGGFTLQTALLNVALLCGLWGYCLLMLSYIILSIKFPELDRPFKAPLGIFGAIYTIVFSIATILSLLIYQSSARYGLIFIGGWYLIGFTYFILYSRKHLRISPEESFAMLRAYNIKFQKNARKRVIV